VNLHPEGGTISIILNHWFSTTTWGPLGGLSKLLRGPLDDLDLFLKHTIKLFIFSPSITKVNSVFLNTQFLKFLKVNCF